MINFEYKKLSSVPIIENFTEDVSNHIMVEDNGSIKRLDKSSLVKVQQLMKSITYSELVSLRDKKKLVPGMTYRLTDYECKVVNNTEARSVSHPFDIILIADSTSSLSENCRACLHEDDDYYSDENCNSNLSAWELRYTLDNDPQRFDWADEVNGKGVIYWLKDDWGNEAPYDFKQIQFKKYRITASPYAELLVDFYASGNNFANILTLDRNDYMWFYTFSISEDKDYIEDFSVHQYGWQVDDSTVKCNNNCILPYIKYSSDDRQTYYLNNNCCIIFPDDENWYYSFSYNYMGYGCSDITFMDASNVKIQDTSRGNVFGLHAKDIQLGQNNFYNLFSYNCDSLVLGHTCSYNTFEDSCEGNKLDLECRNNRFGSSSSYNILMQRCEYNELPEDCGYNIFEPSCNHIKLDEHAHNIYVESESCYLNIIGDETGNYVNHLQNIHVLGKVKGTSSNLIDLEFPLSLNYVMFVGYDEQDILRSECLFKSLL